MHQLTSAAAAARGLKPDINGRWQSATLKFFADGIVGARTAAVAHPYCDADTTGLLVGNADDLEREIIAAHLAGWQVAVHAVGDRAIANVINAFERANAAQARPDARHRIEHFFCPPSGGLDRMKALGASSSCSRAF